MDFVTVYITAKDLEEARKIGETLIRERLLGCVNIIPKIESIYWWKGNVEKENEAVIIGKTRKSLINKTIARIKEIHSYDVPCVTILPIISGNNDYFEWLEKETSE